MERDVVDLLTRLVEIDSVNPSLVAGAAGEVEIAAFVAGWALEAGLLVEVVEETPGRPSVVVRSNRTGDGRTLLLCGHLDTVGVGGMTDPLVARVDGDRMYARGAYDMKAGLAAALIACREADRAGIGGEVVVAAVADEEHSSTGVQEVLRHVTADAAIVCEPTELTVVTSHKGFVWTEIRVVGKAAHGSRPHLGEDAILKTGPVLVALERLNERLRGSEHPRLGPGTLHASLITGGREESTVPDLCVLTIERRTLPGEAVADVERDVADLLASCDVRATSRTTLAREPFETDDDHAFVGEVVAAVTGALGRPAELAGASYWADSAFISAAGIPTVLFGPPGDGAHAEVEWVGLEGTVECARALVATAKGFCR
ncbi:M20/M25/M40 family metallo-hydrolase [Umezawaea sp. Da 62-37]|uniref:M20/M25/M40 family metallo-hydrolase n=1 Tax=Umezawaea sp. Da 62-37 TaxID=3075927 RepID=UPI0028F6C1DE|nr:M20/M25/M40 family metallo-hydrolase [Umezawaea sp. Da 62-37]WNV90055.1 M20/M25/M40 family metallo-hydrolase [Umezawaea sp. Da 62-37]